MFFINPKKLFNDVMNISMKIVIKFVLLEWMNCIEKIKMIKSKKNKLLI